MADVSLSLRCPGCRGERFCIGKLIESDDLFPKLQFKPAANWIEQYAVHAATCLDCGVITLVVDDKTIAKLRKQHSA